jgi:hypothetical protein
MNNVRTLMADDLGSLLGHDSREFRTAAAAVQMMGDRSRFVLFVAGPEAEPIIREGSLAVLDTQSLNRHGDFIDGGYYLFHFPGPKLRWWSGETAKLAPVVRKVGRTLKGLRVWRPRDIDADPEVISYAEAKSTCLGCVVGHLHFHQNPRVMGFF